MVALTDAEFRALEKACGNEAMSAYLRRLVKRHLTGRRK
jgi:hypothetical protein